MKVTDLRRSTHQHTSVSYGEVGATRAADLMSYPPAGFRPEEYRTRIGHGDERFAAAAEQALSWQIQKRSGIQVRVDEVPAADDVYLPVSYDDSGLPVPRTAEQDPRASSGTASAGLIVPGTSATLTYTGFGIRMSAPVRVVYVIDELRRKGLALGTMHGHPLCGEESWIIEQTEDGSVWMSIRLFWRPATWPARFARPLVRAVRAVYVKRYLRSLLGSADAPVPGQGDGPDPSAAERSPGS